ncbi:hypothetical protein Pcinc_002007 [Petrolisthes cinctipes]|uniref:Uncharacterized protein n=1 Tax=Petrolisthes cinctipes TaxID=88211 RepID=A0AAE1GLT0_PETCI|nr:hypothetical protein Pcinc_002007 [Petrolisthes cinctipes]
MAEWEGLAKSVWQSKMGISAWEGDRTGHGKQTTSKVEDCAVAVLDEEEPDTSPIVPPSTYRKETWRHVKVNPELTESQQNEECSGEAAASRVNCETIEVLPRDVPVGVPGIHRGRGRNEAAGVQGGENSESS